MHRSCPRCLIPHLPYEEGCSVCGEPFMTSDEAARKKTEWDGLPEADRNAEMQAHEARRAEALHLRSKLELEMFWIGLVGAGLLVGLLSLVLIPASSVTLRIVSALIGCALGATGGWFLQHQQGGKLLGMLVVTGCFGFTAAISGGIGFIANPDEADFGTMGAFLSLLVGGMLSPALGVGLGMFIENRFNNLLPRW